VVITFSVSASRSVPPEKRGKGEMVKWVKGGKNLGVEGSKGRESKKGEQKKDKHVSSFYLLPRSPFLPFPLLLMIMMFRI